MLKRMVEFPVGKYIRETLLRVMGVTALATVVPVLVTCLMTQDVLRLVTDCAATLAVSCIVICFVGLKDTERTFVWNKLKGLVKGEE